MTSAGHGTQQVFLQVPTAVITIISSAIPLSAATVTAQSAPPPLMALFIPALPPARLLASFSFTKGCK